MNLNIFDRISFFTLFFFVILLPVFFLPFTNFSIDADKSLFLVIGVILSLIAWIVARFSDGKIVFSKSLCLITGGGVVIATLLSGLFSQTLSVSLFGTLLDVGTFWFVLCAFILMVISSIVFRDSRNVRVLLFGIMVSATVMLVFQTLRLFFPSFLSLGVFSAKTDNLLGSFNALGVFQGLYVLLALFIYEFFPLTKWIKVTLASFLVLSLLFIALVNFTLIWVIVGIFALFIFIYKASINVSKSKDNGKIDFPLMSFIVVLIALFFFMAPVSWTVKLPVKLGIQNTEVNPSILSTASITKSVILQDPIFGTGPNKFAEAWALFKPIAINNTAFWDVFFTSGSGLITTFMATTGILGILAWVLFLGSFIFFGVKSLFFKNKESLSHEKILFFFLSLYLIIASLFYFTGVVLCALLFIFMGIFIGLVSSTTEGEEVSISFFDDHRKSFFSMLFLVFLMIILAGFGFKYVQKFMSVSYFTNTLRSQNLESAEVAMRKALSLNTNDLYFRTYAQIEISKFSSLITKDTTSLSEADKSTLQISLDQAVSSGEQAVKYNPKNYLNHEMLGLVFQTAGSLGVKDANGKAIESYKNASALNPKNPRLNLVIANIYFNDNKIKEAKEYATTALTLKPDYIDGLIVLSKVLDKEGNHAEAISYAERALSLLPNNADLIKYVESLKNGNSSSSTSTSAVKDVPNTNKQ